MTELRRWIDEAAGAVRKHSAANPRVGIILGTGLGGLAAQIESPATIPYAEIPHFPISTVETHAGQLVWERCKASPSWRWKGDFIITKATRCRRSRSRCA